MNWYNHMTDEQFAALPPSARHLLEAQCLEAAAQRIVDRGWTQGIHGDTRRGYCASGAIKAEIERKNGMFKHLSPRDMNTVVMLSVISDPSSYRWAKSTQFNNVLVVWNDFNGRTKQQVVAQLRKTATEIRGFHGLSHEPLIGEVYSLR